MKDYYEILEINKKASSEMVESAYKILSKKYKAENADSKKINDVIEAYKVLSDTFLREQYDLELDKEINAKNINKSNNNTTKNSTETLKRKEQKEITRKENVVEEPKKKHKFIKENQFATARTLYGLSSDIFKFGKEAIINLKNKKMEREDWIAMGLTVVVMIIIGIILWFIPFTNGWMREITVDNPLIKWIFNK